MRDKKFLKKAFNHIKGAYQEIERKNYQQEAGYIAAVMGRLNGTITSPHTSGSMTFKFDTVIVNDRGPGAAENKYGADFAIVFKKLGVGDEVSKAVIGQAKNGSSEKLNKKERERLIKQCEDMHRHTSEYVVIEAPRENESGPMVRLGDVSQPLKIRQRRISLESYILNNLVGCSHGDRRDHFVDAVQDSSLRKLEVVTNGLDLDLKRNLDDPTMDP